MRTCPQLGCPCYLKFSHGPNRGFVNQVVAAALLFELVAFRNLSLVFAMALVFLDCGWQVLSSGCNGGRKRMPSQVIVAPFAVTSCRPGRRQGNQKTQRDSERFLAAASASSKHCKVYDWKALVPGLRQFCRALARTRSEARSMGLVFSVDRGQQSGTCIGICAARYPKAQYLGVLL